VALSSLVLAIRTLGVLLLLAAIAGCGGGSAGSASSPTVQQASPVASPGPVQAPAANAALTVPRGFYVEAIATVGGARQLVAASNGDLLVGTNGNTIAIVPNAESSGVVGAAKTFITLSDQPAQGIALGANGTLYAGTNTGVWGAVTIASHLRDRTRYQCQTLRKNAFREIQRRIDSVRRIPATMPITVPLPEAVASSCQLTSGEGLRRATRRPAGRGGEFT
jgi:hypothetical protein